MLILLLEVSLEISLNALKHHLCIATYQLVHNGMLHVTSYNWLPQAKVTLAQNRIDNGRESCYRDEMGASKTKQDQ